ncbi:MAG: acyltransferase family protein [Anaerolineales bacterium]
MTEIYKPQGVLRFFLALFVLWSHSLIFFLPEFSGWFPKLQLGNVAVACFFVLSGYLMYEASQSWYRERPGAFILNRYLRIIPPYLMAALVSIATHFGFAFFLGSVAGIDTIPPDAITQKNASAAVLSGLFPFSIFLIKPLGLSDPSYDFVRFSWAIFTELLFYWALFAFMVARSVIPYRIANASVLAGALLCSAIGFLFYNGAFLNVAPRLVELAIKIPFAFHLQWTPHFILGVAISILSRRPSFGAGLLLATASALAIAQIAVYAMRQGAVSTMLVIVGYVLLVSIIYRISRLSSEQIASRWWLSKSLDRRYGNLSYPVYINQFGLSVAFLSFAMAAGWMIENASFPQRLAYFLMYNVFIIVTSWVLIQITDVITHSVRQRIRGGAI